MSKFKSQVQKGEKSQCFFNTGSNIMSFLFTDAQDLFLYGLSAKANVLFKQVNLNVSL